VSDQDYGLLLFVAVFCACALALGWFITEVTILPDMTPEQLSNLRLTSPWASVRRAEEARQKAALVVQYPDWPWPLINAHRVQLGMTKEMVQTSLGRPNDITRSVGSRGVSEQWVYGSYPSTMYLYFKNEILTSWQD